MNSYMEDIDRSVRHSKGNEEQDDDDFSMSSYDGDQTDSLNIKPPQPNAQRREKRDKRDKRDRHRHKAERHKERHRTRDQQISHDERRREHRRQRERDPERRELRRHEKNREKANKHERATGDLRNKLDKDRKLVDRDSERRRDRMREEIFVDEREIYDMKHREYFNTNIGPMAHHRDRRLDEKNMHMQVNFNAMDPQLSPGERAEKKKRMERFMVADKQKEVSQREADQRRQKREEERREEKRMEVLRHRAHASMMRNAAKNLGSPSHDSMNSRKRMKTVHDEHSKPEMVEIISDDEMSPYIDDTMIENPIREKSKKKKRRKRMQELDEEEEMEEEIEDEEDEEELDGDEEELDDEELEDSKRSSSISLPTSDSDSSSDSSEQQDEDGEEEEEEEEDEEEEEVEEAIKKEDSSPVKIIVPDTKEKNSNTDTSTDNEETTDDEKDKIDENSTRTEKDADETVEASPVKSPIEPKEELPMYLPAIMGCRSVDEFECLNKIDEGTYGVVYRAREKTTNVIVALKRLKMEKEKEGFPITSLREVNTLLKGQHENIVTVREIVVGSNMDKIYIVMDYVEHDLKSLMETMTRKKQMFTIGEVKTLMLQLLSAIHHLHDNWILHRDLKTSNLLLSHRGILKVGDFGLAREYGSPLKQYTPIVVTLWYRAPELLLGCREYSCPIDAWSVGCIFGELLNMEPMFPGKSEIDELNRIFKELGTPSDKIWPEYSQLPVIKKTQFAFHPYNHLKEKFKSRLSSEGFNLLNSFLTYNPAKRITCAEAIKHNYFRCEDPVPIDPAMFPTWPAKSEHPAGIIKKAPSPKPPSGGKNFKALGDGEDEAIAGFFLGGPPGSGPGFTLKF